MRGRDAALSQTIGNRIGGKCRVMLFAGEALLLSSSDDLAIPQEASGAIMVKRGDSKNVNGTCRKRIGARFDPGLRNHLRLGHRKTLVEGGEEVTPLTLLHWVGKWLICGRIASQLIGH